MEKRPGILLSCILLFLISTGCKQEEKHTPPPITTVKTQTISFEKSLEYSIYPGSVKGRYETHLSFQIPGKIKNRYIERGSQVHQGELLLEIDPKDIVENIRIAKAQFDAAQSTLLLAKTDLKRYEHLYSQKIVSTAQYESYKANFDIARSQFKQAEAQYNQRQNELSYSKLTSKADGIISSVETEVGQVVAAGQVVATLVETKELEVEITVPEQRILNLSLGQNAMVSFWALPDIKLKGVIREISPIADILTRMYKVKVQLTTIPPGLQFGMTASAKIDMNTHNTRSIIMLPVSAILHTTESPQVWVVNQNRVESRPISVGEFNGNRVIVTSGLYAGDIVVIAGVHKLQENQTVQVLNTGKK